MDALSAHYGSTGRLANYRLEFDQTVRKSGEDPSNFTIALETLAVKAFGDMGQAACLRLIRDRFIAGHGSCDLRRYLDCVPPDTPLWDIVDRLSLGVGSYSGTSVGLGLTLGRGSRLHTLHLSS